MNSKPIKRHLALISLSKDHHFGLLLSWKIRKGAELNISIERVVNYVVHFFDTELEYHFHEEEELLFDQMAPDDSLRIRAVDEHKLMREQIQELRKNPAVKTLYEFSDLLENHIRFEERQLFNHIQETFSEESLSQIAEQLKNRNHPQVGMWSDAFLELITNDELLITNTCGEPAEPLIIELINYKLALQIDSGRTERSRRPLITSITGPRAESRGA